MFLDAVVWHVDAMASLRQVERPQASRFLSVVVPSVVGMDELLAADAPAFAVPSGDGPDWPEPTDEEIEEWWADRVTSESDDVPPESANLVTAAETQPLS